MNTKLNTARLGWSRALAVLVGASVATVLVTAVTAPLVVAALHGLGVSGVRPDKVVIRTLELVAIAVTVFALLRLGGGGKAAWGIAPRHRLARRLGLGFLFGLLSLGAVCMLLFVFDVRIARQDLPVDPGYWLLVVVKASLSAVAVGLLEELWFRGGLFTLLRRCGGLTLAVLGGSLFYAAAHFLKIPGGLSGADAQHWNTLQLLEAAVLNVFQVQHLDSLAALFIAGVTLALVRLRQGDVALCIGIHAGWVLTIKVFKKLTYMSPTETNRFLVGRYDEVIGWAAAACLAVMLVLVWRFMRAPLATTATEGEPRV